jgi:hypothetical protein
MEFLGCSRDPDIALDTPRALFNPQCYARSLPPIKNRAENRLS